MSGRGLRRLPFQRRGPPGIGARRLSLEQAPNQIEQEDQLGDAGRERLGSKNWEREVQRVVAGFKQAFIANYVVLGGGNAKLLEDLPAGAELGHNRNAFAGGQRLWQGDPRTGRPAWRII